VLVAAAVCPGPHSGRIAAPNAAAAFVTSGAEALAAAARSTAAVIGRSAAAHADPGSPCVGRGAARRLWASTVSWYVDERMNAADSTPYTANATRLPVRPPFVVASSSSSVTSNVFP
jgi:hypothetical protein